MSNSLTYEREFDSLGIYNLLVAGILDPHWRRISSAANSGIFSFQGDFPASEILFVKFNQIVEDTILSQKFPLKTRNALSDFAGKSFYRGAF